MNRKLIIGDGFLYGVTFSMAAGIFAARETNIFPAVSPLAVALPTVLAIMAALLSMWREEKLSRLFAAFGAAFFLLGALRFSAADILPANDISRFDGQELTVVGKVRNAPEIFEAKDGRRRIRYLVDATAIKTKDGEKNISGGFYLYAPHDEKPARIGDMVRASGMVKLPHGYKNPGQIDIKEHLKSQGITASLSAGKAGITTERREGEFFRRKIADIRTSYMLAMEKAMGKSDAAAIFAMLFGGYGGLKEELTESFTVTGIVHILSVSGSHITMVAAFVVAFGRLLGLSKDLRLLLTVFAVAVYTMLAGCVPPAVRAAVMGTLVFAAAGLGRDRDAGRILAITTLVMLMINPLLLFNISFRLSFLATAGLVFIAPVLQKAMENLRHVKFLMTVFSMTAAITLSSLPLLAWHFNMVSLSSFVANAILVPIVEIIIVVALLAGIAAAVLPILGQVVFAFDALLLGLVYGAAQKIANFPYASVYAPALPSAAVVGYYAVIVFILQQYQRRRKICAFLRNNIFPLGVTLAAVAVIFAARQITDGDEIKVHFIDVGQGAAALVQTPHNHAFMIDTGGVRGGDFDVGKRVDLPYLLHYGVRKLDFIFLTHAHEDHAAGAGALLAKIPVGAVITAHEPLEEYLFGMGIRTGDAPKEKFITAQEGTTFEIDGVTVEILFAPATAELRTGGGNELSNVYRVTYGGVSFLFVGDLIKEQEEVLLRKGIDPKSTVLQVGHHGSAGSGSQKFVEAVAPEYAVFCVGAYNSFGHPRAEVTERFEAAGAKILRTDKDGAIVFTAGGKGLRVSTFVER